MTVRFFDVGQALSALVELPDGRRVLVDAGESPTRCGAPCRAWHERLLGRLRAAAASRLDLLWITHQHSDHLGGAPAVIEAFRPLVYVDNGRDLDKHGVRAAREAAAAHGVTVRVVDPEQRRSPLAERDGVRLTPLVPAPWPSSCHHDPNDCSIALRIDYCRSSVLFTGDAGAHEEGALDTQGPASLLQVGHHGSDTSSSKAFLARVRPRYAVISSGRPGEGTNRTYCHPRAVTVERVTAALGGAGVRSIRAFDGAVACKMGTDANWVEVPASDRLWATARDGDVALVTTGDGAFYRHE